MEIGALKPTTSATRAVLGVVVPALALVAMAWMFIHGLVGYERAHTVREAERENANLALALEEHTARTIGSARELLEFVAEEYAEHGRAMNLQELARARSLDGSFITSVAILDAAGNVAVGDQGSFTGNFSDRDYFRYHRDTPGVGLLIGKPVQGRLTGRKVILVTRRIEDSDGRFAGVAAVGLNPDYFGEFYRQMDIGANGMVLLVGLDGITRARRVGSASTAGQDMRGSALLQEQVRRPNGSFLSAGRIEGVHRYTSYRTIPESSLIVAVGTSVDEVLAPFYERRTLYLWTGSVFTLLVVAFTALVLLMQRRRRDALDDHLRAEARFRATFDQAAVAMAHVDLQGRVAKVNPKLCEMIGYAEQELLGRSFSDFKFPEDRVPAERAREEMLRTGLAPAAEHRYRRKDGSALWADVSISLVRDPRGNPDYFVAVAQDTTAQKQAQAQVLHQATHDLLTDLPNRALFQDRLEQALKQAQRQGWTGGMLFMDLDRFKAVNDTFGHAAGDALLREVGTRLARAVRATDSAARIGGDEFAVVLGELAQPGDAALVARKILRELAAPIDLEGREYFVTVSIGITLFPADGRDSETLLRNADAAMFKAKQAGRNCHQFFTPETAAQAA